MWSASAPCWGASAMWAVAASPRANLGRLVLDTRKVTTDLAALWAQLRVVVKRNPLRFIQGPRNQAIANLSRTPRDGHHSCTSLPPHITLLFSQMESFKLGVLGLPQAEQSLVATLFRLHRVDPSFAWTLTTAPPFDALLVDSSLPTMSYVHCVDQRTRVKRLGPQGRSNPWELPRPIRSDLLIEWLSSIEIPLLQELRRVGPENGTLGANPVAKSPTSNETNAPVEGALPHAHTMFKLRRWPAPGVLAQDTSRLRMATLLSRKSMHLSELAMLSRVTSSACLAYLRELDAHGVLEFSMRNVQRSPLPPRYTLKAAPTLAARARTTVRGLFAGQQSPSIRNGDSMTEHKIIITGSMGAGKTTAVRTVSEVTPIVTDVALHERNVDKTMTTVGFDYGQLTLDNGERLHLFGTPGQSRFRFVWQAVAKGALGLIILTDNANADPLADLHLYLEGFAAELQCMPCVVGVGRSDTHPHPGLEIYADELERAGYLFPIIPVDARRKEDVTLLIDLLLSQLNADLL